jgi:hypothetical protein
MMKSKEETPPGGGGEESPPPPPPPSTRYLKVSKEVRPEPIRTCSSSSVSIWLIKPTLNSVAKMCRVAINSSCSVENTVRR